MNFFLYSSPTKTKFQNAVWLRQSSSQFIRVIYFPIKIEEKKYGFLKLSCLHTLKNSELVDIDWLYKIL